MDAADREDGGNCCVQDPDQDREEEGDVADLSSSTGSAAAGACGGGVPRVYRPSRPARSGEMLVSRETFRRS
jgi:hypothetical protein